MIILEVLIHGAGLLTALMTGITIDYFLVVRHRSRPK